jgi:hypothetical protein
MLTATHHISTQLLDDAIMRESLADHWLRMLRRDNPGVNFLTGF